MSDEQKSEEAGAPKPAPATDVGEPTEMEILAGGVDSEVVKIDKTSERVKVKLLVWSELPEYGAFVSNRDEASQAELLCGKIDKSRNYNLSNARSTEQRFLGLLRETPIDKQEDVEKRLNNVREEIKALEAKARWADQLSESSLIELLKTGARLNAKRYGRWLARTNAATGLMLKEVTASQEASLSPQSS